MQHELLIEFFSEEIPARFQKKAIKDSEITFKKILDEYGAIYKKVSTYVSTRRITIHVEQISPKTKEFSEKKRGPRISAPENAINGFLRSNNMSKEDLFEQDGYFYLNVETKCKDIRTIIKDMIEDFIANMPWQKSMRWYIESQKELSAFWVRPIRSIMCLYEGSPIEVHIDSVGIATCDYTFGHRFLSKDKIRVFDFEDYKHKLEKNYVILDYFKKRNLIELELVQNAAAMGLCLTYDEGLLEEVAGLVEYPFIHIGAIDEKFMKLPNVVLSTSMKVHQKYFTLTYPDSVIAPFFGTVTNVPGTKVMYEGLDRVLRARLSDAQFFYKEDTDATLETFTQRLSNVVFHEKLGSMAQKIDRMMSVANTKEEHRAISLCKSDLLTQMVVEFPELQGIMGEIYANVQSESPDVCTAIREHYKPLGANDTLPQTKTGARLSFFDKLDTLVGFLGVGIYPTGSKDPFALRRAALCIVRLLCDFKEDILDGETLTWYASTLMTSYSDQGIALDPDTADNVLNFLIDRFKVFLEDRLDVNPELVEHVISSFESKDFDYKEAVSRAKNLKDLMAQDEFYVIEEAFKRAKGVIGDTTPEENINLSDLSFDNEIMKNLKEKFELFENKTDDFEVALELSKDILNACENVLMNDQNENIRRSNISLLYKFIKILSKNFHLN